MSVLAADIGGTKIAAARIGKDARILERLVVPTRAAEGFEISIVQLESALDACFDDSVTAIGLCSPGPVKPNTGMVLNPPNLPGWRDIPLAARISARYARPCTLENDANAAGLAEARFGAGRGCSSVLYVTLSTGIGTGIILDGKVYHGKNGQAAEGGHTTIDYRGAKVCNCGVAGCIEGLASGTAIARRAGMLAEDVGRLAAAGDETANALLDETAEMLSAWLGNMISLLDPDVIVIGGGVSQLGESLFSRLRALTPARSINLFAHQTPIVPAQLGPDAGLLGAAVPYL